jgi:RNA polymerase sigma factor (sigma-70 family)
MTEKEDIPNMSLARSKELMLEYQETRDPALFSLLLAKFDKYIIRLVHKFKKSYEILEDEGLQELYHTAILGFHKALMGMKEKHKPEYMFLFFTAFVKYELRRMYEYKVREVSYEVAVTEAKVTEGEHLSHKMDEMFTEFDLTIMREVLNSQVLTEADKIYVELRYKKGMTYGEIGKVLVLTDTQAHNRGKNLFRKVRKIFRKDIELCKDKEER